MIKRKWFLGMLPMLVCFGALSSCATTHSVTYANDGQPKGNYKYAVISANSFDGSVLQRFYAKYPSDKYQVVAHETQCKHWLPLVTGLGAGLVGAGIGGAALSGGGGQYVGAGIGGGLFGAIGYLIGYIFKDKYIVTYIER